MDATRPQGIVAELSGAFAGARGLLSNLLDLFGLEARRAGLVLVLMLACGVLGAVLMVAAWIGLLAALVLWAVRSASNGRPPSPRWPWPIWRRRWRSSGCARASAARSRFRRLAASCGPSGSSSSDMPPASIAAAERRVIESRRELRGAMRRVGARLARPSSLLAAAAAGALVGFSVTRLGAGALARGLAAALLRRAGSS